MSPFFKHMSRRLIEIEVKIHAKLNFVYVQVPEHLCKLVCGIGDCKCGRYQPLMNWHIYVCVGCKIYSVLCLKIITCNCNQCDRYYLCNIRIELRIHVIYRLIKCIIWDMVWKC